MLFAVMVRFCVIFISSFYSFSSLGEELRCDYVVYLISRLCLVLA